MLASLCLSRDGGARFDDDPEGFARAAGLDDEDAARVAAQRRGVAVYRTLVRHNLADTLTRALPRTRDALGDGFEEALGDFLERAPPRSRYLREVPGEFARRLADRGDEVAPWLVDLARFEWAEFDAAHAGGDDEPAAPLRLERPVRLHPSAHVLSLGWRAHDPSADPALRARCELLVHRAEDDDVVVEEITPATRALLAALRDGQTLEEALRGALAEVAPAEQPAALAAAVACVEALETRGVLGGAH
jgi:hypothetical protein